MFGGIKKRWAEARVASLSEFVIDILRRYEGMNPLDRYVVSSAFDTTLSVMQDQLGDLKRWTSDQKREAAKVIIRASLEAGRCPGNNMEAETTRLGANGSALLSFYLELKTLPGNQAIESMKKSRSGGKPALDRILR